MLSRRRTLVAFPAAALLGTAATLRPATFAKADSEPDQAELAKAGPDGDVVLGSDKAPVTIIEYASMTCPHCAHFSSTTFPELQKRYIDTGKVRYIFREFPLDALAAAGFMLARCAGKDKFMPIVETLFAKQQEWMVEKPMPPLTRHRQAIRFHPAIIRRVPGESKGARRHSRRARPGRGEARGELHAYLFHQRQEADRRPVRSTL